MENRNVMKRIGLWAATSFVISNMVGVGIFTTSGFMLADLRSPLLLLFVWGLGGVLALAGAATYGELGALLPRVGGDYVYLKEAYGRPWAFLSGWMAFFVGLGAPIAATSIGFVEHLTPFFPGLATQGHPPLAKFLGLSPTFSAGHGLALCSIWLLTLAHYLGIRFSGRMQVIVTGFNLLMMTVFLAIAAGSGAGDWTHLSGPSAAGQLSFSGSLPVIGVSLIIVMYAYSGFNAAAYVTGEIDHPGRNLPRALILGTSAVTVLYLALNLSYIYALPFDEMGGKLNVGELAAIALTGPGMGRVFSGFLALTILGCASVMICIGPRMYYAMAEDGLFFTAAGRKSKRFGTPGAALALQATWASILVICGSFYQLLTYCSFMISLFSALTVSTVFVLRRRAALLSRPYRVRGYPFTPAFYVAAAVWMMCYTLLEHPGESLIGIGIVASGIPVYILWRARHRKTGRQAGS